MGHFQDLRGSWCSTITTPTPSIAPNSTAESSLFVVRIESLMAPLNPRLTVSQMYLTLKGGLRADIKGGGGVGGFWEGKEKETISVFPVLLLFPPTIADKKGSFGVKSCWDLQRGRSGRSHTRVYSDLALKDQGAPPLILLLHPRLIRRRPPPEKV